MLVVPANTFHKDLDVCFSIVSLGTARVSVIDKLEPMLTSIFVGIDRLLGDTRMDPNTTRRTGSFFFTSLE